MINTVVFPVAGLGTRFLPATKAVPKEMLPVVDRPLIQWAVEEAAQAGCRHFVFVSAPEKGAIMNHFGTAPHYETQLQKKGKTEALDLLKAGLPDGARITQVFQPEPLGLGHAVWCAHEAIEEEDAFAVILPDDLVLNGMACLKQMVDTYAHTGGNLVAVENVPADQTNRYGVLDPISERDNLIAVKGLVEKPAPEDAPSTLAIIGRYILDASIMKTLNGFRTGAGNEVQLTDAIADQIGTVPMHGFRFAGTRYDCGSRNGFIAANLAFALSPHGAGQDATMTADLRGQIAPILAES